MKKRKGVLLPGKKYAQSRLYHVNIKTCPLDFILINNVQNEGPKKMKTSASRIIT